MSVFFVGFLVFLFTKIISGKFPEAIYELRSLFGSRKEMGLQRISKKIIMIIYETTERNRLSIDYIKHREKTLDKKNIGK